MIIYCVSVCRGGGGALTSQLGRECRWGIQNLTLSQTARRTQKYTLSQYTLLKTFISIPCCNITHIGNTLSCCCFTVKRNENSKSVASCTHRRWCRDRGPVISIVGWEPGWEAL